MILNDVMAEVAASPDPYGTAGRNLGMVAGGIVGGELAVAIAVGVGVLTGPIGLGALAVGAVGALVGGYMGAQGVANLNAAAFDMLQGIHR